MVDNFCGLLMSDGKKELSRRIEEEEGQQSLCVWIRFVEGMECCVF